MKPIELSNNTFTKDILDTTVFFKIAESGAMGEPGGIDFITEQGKIYHANYCYGDLERKTIQNAFPIINECRFGLFGMGSEVPKGWQYVSLGMGNHLIVRDDYYDKFASVIAHYKSPGEIYQNWIEQALKIWNHDLEADASKGIQKGVDHR